LKTERCKENTASVKAGTNMVKRWLF